MFTQKFELKIIFRLLFGEVDLTDETVMNVSDGSSQATPGMFKKAMHSF